MERRRCGLELIPGRRRRDVIRVQQLLVAHHDHRAGVLRVRVDAVALRHLRHGPGHELVLDVVRAVLGQVCQLATRDERRQVLELDLDDIGDIRVGLERRLECGVLGVAVALVDVVDVDGRLGRVEAR